MVYLNTLAAKDFRRNGQKRFGHGMVAQEVVDERRHRISQVEQEREPETGPQAVGVSGKLFGSPDRANQETGEVVKYPLHHDAIREATIIAALCAVPSGPGPRAAFRRGSRDIPLS